MQKTAKKAKAAKADRTGKAHQADVAKTVFKILAGVDESSHRSPNSDEAVQSAACRLVAEAREELVREIAVQHVLVDEEALDAHRPRVLVERAEVVHVLGGVPCVVDDEEA